MAKVDRFQSHLKLFKELEGQAFSFTIFDEPFSGINPVEGPRKIARSAILKIGKTQTSCPSQIGTQLWA